jgi:hypothetical protein
MIEYISAGIALISVAAAVFFGLRSQRLQRENTDLQKRLLEIEEAREKERQQVTRKAQLSAHIEEYGRNSHRLVIGNAGNAEARNISLVMDGKPFDEHQAAVSGEGKISRIGAHSSATRLLGITMGCAPPFELEISWDDDSGEKGSYQTTLTF